MPNHDTNNVVIIGAPENIRRFVDEALVDYPTMDGDTPIDTTGKPEKIIDFNRIKPMPDELGQTVSPHELVATQEEADTKNAEYVEKWKDSPLGGGQTIKYLTVEEVTRRIREYGAVDWYAWSTGAWGTKWNAYSHTHYDLSFHQPSADEAVYGRVELRFDTAWSQPTPIFEAIQERWGVTVYAVTQDEGGFPDVWFPDEDAVSQAEVMRRTVTFEFDCWDKQVDEPQAVKE